MTDHYLAYLQAEVRTARQQIGHLQGRLDAAHEVAMGRTFVAVVSAGLLAWAIDKLWRGPK